MTRQQERDKFTVDVRVVLLEADVDEVERHLGVQRVELQKDIDALRDDLKAIRTILMGILVSLATGCVLFTLNIVVGALHR